MEARCTGKVRHPVVFSDGETKDRIRISVDAETCEGADANVIIRTEGGEVLMRETFPLAELALTETPSRENLHTLLARFSDNVRRRRAEDLPAFEEATETGPKTAGAHAVRCARLVGFKSSAALLVTSVPRKSGLEGI